VLAAGGIVAMVDPQRWGQTRASTLGFSLLVTATAYDGMIAWMDTTSWFDERIGVVAAGIAILFAMGHAVQCRCLPVARGGVRFRPFKVGAASY
jgi:hypothetical protein